MIKRFSKIIIVGSVLFSLFLFGCAQKKVNTSDEQPKDNQAVQSATDNQKTKDAKAEEAVKAEELAKQKKLEQEKKEAELKKQEEERQKKEAKAKFQNEKVFFAFDSAELNEDAQKILENKAEWLRQNEDAKITIEGNCDERGTTAYNLALGERRAESAKKYLVALGINGDRIVTISYGEEKPAVIGSGKAVWAKNRRDEFIINSGL